MSSGLEEELQALHEVVEAAHKKLPRNIWGYLVGGTETETTVARNRHALDQVAFKPRVCRDVSAIDMTRTVFGKKVRLPVALAPVGSLESFEEGGGATVAKAAAHFGVPYFLSSVTKPGLEDAAKAAPDAHRIFQLYVRGDDAFVDDYVKRARDSGYETFCITVDTAIYSRRERDLVNRFKKPWRVRATGQDYQASWNWDNVKRFKDKHDIPLILKGINTGEDAAIAIDHGVEGIYVSNHGGRQLDHGRGAIACLPEVVEAVAGRATVILDGAICRGTDIVKAVALGADFVVIGRLMCYGLAAAGEAGVVRVLELLEEEVNETLGLLGAHSFGEVNKTWLTTAPAMVSPHVHSAFPHLRLPDWRSGV
jgi:isopentenyl diphosphate isomerase/L-lactate dehydrogenase-like FMN-dependent dehydrogenase